MADVSMSAHDGRCHCIVSCIRAHVLDMLGERLHLTWPGHRDGQGPQVGVDIPLTSHRVCRVRAVWTLPLTSHRVYRVWCAMPSTFTVTTQLSPGWPGTISVVPTTSPNGAPSEDSGSPNPKAGWVSDAQSARTQGASLASFPLPRVASPDSGLLRESSLVVVGLTAVLLENNQTTREVIPGVSRCWIQGKQGACPRLTEGTREGVTAGKVDNIADTALLGRGGLSVRDEDIVGPHPTDGRVLPWPPRHYHPSHVRTLQHYHRRPGDSRRLRNSTHPVRNLRTAPPVQRRAQQDVPIVRTGSQGRDLAGG